MKKILIKTTDEQLMLITHAEYLNALDSAERFGGVAGFQVVGEVSPPSEIPEGIEPLKQYLLKMMNNMLSFDPEDGIVGQKDVVNLFANALVKTVEDVAAAQQFECVRQIKSAPIIKYHFEK